MVRTIFITFFTIALSFYMGKLAGKTSAEKLESSIIEVIQVLQTVEEVQEINQQAPQNTSRKSLFSDPNL